MAVSYTLNRFITAKKSDVAFNTTNCCCNQREKILRFFLNRFCNCKPVDKIFFYTNNIINCIKKNPGGGRAVTTGTKFFFSIFWEINKISDVIFDSDQRNYWLTDDLRR
jgi:hypothetical protein